MNQPTIDLDHQGQAAALQSLLGTALPPTGVAKANVELEKFHQARARA